MKKFNVTALKHALSMLPKATVIFNVDDPDEELDTVEVRLLSDSIAIEDYSDSGYIDIDRIRPSAKYPGMFEWIGGGTTHAFDRKDAMLDVLLDYITLSASKLQEVAV